MSKGKTMPFGGNELPAAIPDPVRGRTVEGAHLDGAATFGEALGSGPTLLMFLRHFG